MERITLTIGTITSTRSGGVDVDEREVEFVGEIIGDDEWYTSPNDDTRGVKQVVYKLEDDRLVVYLERWTRWQGETSTREIKLIMPADLEPGGMFERVGRSTDYARPMTIDEAINNE